MLTDKELGALAPKEKPYKASDRDGLYAMVLTTGTKAFRYDYRINGRRETLAIGRYDPTCKEIREPEVLEYGMKVSLREARTLLDCIDPAEPAQVMPLKRMRMPRLGFSFRAPGVDAGRCKSVFSRRSRGWHAGWFRSDADARTVP